jgi:hypothetical protein
MNMRTIPFVCVPALLLFMLLNCSATASVDEPLAQAGAVVAQLPRESRFLAAADGETPTAWSRVRNAGDELRRVRLELLLTSPDDRETPHDYEFDLSPGMDERVLFPRERLDLNGIYTVRFRLKLDGEVSVWQRDVLARYWKNRPADKGESAFPIGFASGAPRPTPWLFDIAASIGFEFHRFETRWPQVQPNADTWNWHVLDSTLDLMVEKRIRFQPLVHGSARWAANNYLDPPEPEAWRRWLTALTDRYQGRAEFWEIWNEPDIGFFRGTVEEYIQMQRVAFEAIKSVAPNEIVASGGFTHLGHGRVKPGIYESTLAEYPAAFDVFAYHRHGTFAELYRDQHVLFADLRRRTGTEEMPIVFTETGMDTRHGQRHQAETLMKKMSYASAIGAKAYTWYNLMDRAGGDHSTRPGHTYGLLTNPTGTGNFAEIENHIQPKEALVAAAAAVRELRGRPHLDTWAQDGRRFAFLFGEPGDHLLVNWLEDERMPEPIWIVAGSMERVTRRDMFGNATPVPVVEGRTLVSLGEPRYYHFEGGTTVPRLLQPLVMVPDRISPGPDGEVLLDLEVRNPLNRAIRVAIELSGAEFRVLDQPTATTILSGDTARLPIRLGVGQGRFGEVKACEIQLRFEDLPWSPTMRVPVSFNTIHAGKGDRLRLDDIGHVTNKHEHDPNTVHLLWSGAPDLSVQADFSADRGDQALKINVVVTDNRQHPAPTGAPILDGDAIEIGWATGDGANGRLEIVGDPGTSPRVERFQKGIPNVHSVVRSSRISRDDDRTTYELVLNLDRMQLMPEDLRGGFRFNFAVHDNDGEGPKSWIAPAPGLGGAAQFDPADFPILRVHD